MNLLRTVVVIPAYNEESTIKEVVTRAKRFADVCVVNDSSKDCTEQIVRSMPGVACVTHIKNTHIPKTILDGMQYAVDNKYDYAITMDAGLSHVPEEIPLFINAGKADLVMGVRKKTRNVPFYRKLLSRIATLLINASLRPIGSKLSPARFQDVTSGYRRYSKRACQLLLKKKMKAKTFDFHTEALMLIYRNGLSISEVPITYHFSNSSLNKRVVMDSLRMWIDFFLDRRK